MLRGQIRKMRCDNVLSEIANNDVTPNGASEKHQHLLSAHRGLAIK
jgi:hypothetical protein